MTEELLQDAKIIGLYKTIVGVIQMILIVKLKLIYLRISSIYLCVSSFSFAKYVTSHKKQEQKMTKKLQYAYIHRSDSIYICVGF